MIVYSSYLPLFEELVARFQDGKIVTPTLISRTLTGMLPELKRDGADIDRLCDEHFRQVFSLVEQAAFSREGIDPVLRILAQRPDISAQKAAAEAGLSGSDTADVEQFIDTMIHERQDFVKEKGMAAVGPLMGVVMAEFRGKVDGKILSDILKQKINKSLSI